MKHYYILAKFGRPAGQVGRTVAASIFVAKPNGDLELVAEAKYNNMAMRFGHETEAMNALAKAGEIPAKYASEYSYFRVMNETKIRFRIHVIAEIGQPTNKGKNRVRDRRRGKVSARIVVIKPTTKLLWTLEGGEVVHGDVRDLINDPRPGRVVAVAAPVDGKIVKLARRTVDLCALVNGLQCQAEEE